jgi:hypothetical protein
MKPRTHIVGSGFEFHSDSRQGIFVTHNLLSLYPANLVARTDENHEKSSIRIVGVPAEIPTGYLQYSSQKPHLEPNFSVLMTVAISYADNIQAYKV